MPSSAPDKGLNDLQTLHPLIASEAFGWDPQDAKAGSSKKKTWKCHLGHIYEATPKHRTLGGTGCPYCANRRVLKGFNDLRTLHPLIAVEADGWDPWSVVPGSNKKLNWKCGEGHCWTATPNTRVSQGSGCPYCANQKALKGFNDILSQHPDLAREADGWDPGNIVSGSHRKLRWKCKHGHTWLARPYDRSVKHTGCPVCANKNLEKGFNDLLTLHESIAAEAFGWNPSDCLAGSTERKKWQCSEGHIWEAKVVERTGKNKTGCPFCSNRVLVAGFNDLQTRLPRLAQEAHGWDPKTVIYGSRRSLEWKCEIGHTWKASLDNRASSRQPGCPYCANQKVLQGFNDLQSTHPLIAAQAYGWDPTRMLCGSSKKVQWKCDKGHIWTTSVDHRTGVKRSGCPICAETGFNPGKQAWFYLMEKPGEQQIGITNVVAQRLRTHSSNGWSVIEVVGPFSGAEVLETETKLKRWIKRKVGAIPGTSENWSTTSVEVRSLAELKRISEVVTDLF